MPNAHDEDIREAGQDAQAPAGEPAPDASEAPAELVLEAELVEGDVDGARPDSVDEGVQDLESAAGESDDETADEVGARPSVHGRLAKPHKAKDAESARPRKKHRPGFGRRIALAVILFILAAMLVVTGLFCWQKWMRFDDAADIQGVWKVQATGDTIVFNSRDLKLTKGISYEYRLDAQDKAITYVFGEFSGGGHYYFSGDRQTLVIIDGDERLGILAEAGFLPDDLIANDDASDSKTVLVKVSNDTSAEPSGTATGISPGKTSGEREYVVQPEPSSSSSSSKKKSSSTKDEDEENAEHRGFVDEDGDGYDDETDLEYDEFVEYQESLNADEDAEDSEDEDAAESEDEDVDGADDAWDEEASGEDDADYQDWGDEGLDDEGAVE